MILGHPHICLYKPEIPQNTGNIARLAAATQSRLHLIKPFGFSADERNLKRPGLDYWPFLDLELHDHLEEIVSCFEMREIAFFSKRGTVPYTSLGAETKLLVFGQETAGFPPEIHERFADRMFTIPMYHPGVRSHNLANSVSIVVYHLLSAGRVA